MTDARAASELTLALLSLAERGLRTHFGAHIIETGTHSYRLTPTLVQRAGCPLATVTQAGPPQPVTERACVRGPQRSRGGGCGRSANA